MDYDNHAIGMIEDKGDNLILILTGPRIRQVVEEKTTGSALYFTVVGKIYLWGHNGP